MRAARAASYILGGAHPMAVSPLIPTSFVPRQPVDAPRPKQSGADLFLIIALSLFGLAILASGAVFGYQQYLKSVANAKQEKVAEAEKRIDEGTVEGFVDLRNRLTASGALLDNHIALSQFLASLETGTLASVTFDTMTISVSDDRTAAVEMTGSAKSFNALAAESAALTDIPSVKRAIFSGLKVDEKTGAVDFSLSFGLDQKGVIGNPAALLGAPAALPAATTTPAAVSSSTPPVPSAPVTAPSSPLPAGAPAAPPASSGGPASVPAIPAP
jgi:hypothetical protein